MGVHNEANKLRERLFSTDYLCLLAANFLLYFGFWLLVPILPFWLIETQNCPKAAMGAVLCLYAISGLFIRPFSGYFLDKFPRKPLYIACYAVCASMFLGYMTANSITHIVLLRIAHGLAFGAVTVGGNTLCVDISPSSRRGEALGYYGLTNNAAMALGPMTGLLMHGSVPFRGIFLTGLSLSLVGLLCALFVRARTPNSLRLKALANTNPDAMNPGNIIGKGRGKRNILSIVSLDRFILPKAIPVSISLLLLSIPYGATTNYVALYARESGLNVPSGFFFTLMAIGMGVARIVAGKRVDQGLITQCIKLGFWPVSLAFILLGSCRFLPNDVAIAIFYLVPLLMGGGFGVMFPAMNSLYINLAPNEKRATATGTYLTAWDVGLFLGIFSGGIIANIASFAVVYLAGGAICLISMTFFIRYVTPHFYANRLR